jgi:hypothetical protein
MGAFFTVGLTGMLALGMTGIAMAQGRAPQPARAESGTSADPRPPVGQEIGDLTKDLELTRTSGSRSEHHDRRRQKA